MPVYNDLISVLKNFKDSDRIILYRNDDELEYLNKWLSSPAETTINYISDDTLNSALEEIIQRCGRCGDVSEIIYGAGSGSNRVMIILNPPRLLSRLELRILKKDSDDLFRKIIASSGLELEECYTTSLIKCESEDLMMKPSRMLENCLEVLAIELERINPVMVLVMGDIIPLQKIIHESVGIIWHNIDHPITLLKTPDLKRKAWNTIKLAMAALKKINVR